MDNNGYPLITTNENENGQPDPGNFKNSDKNIYNYNDNGPMKFWNTLSTFVQKEVSKKNDQAPPTRLINPLVLNCLSSLSFPPVSTTTTTTTTASKYKNIIKPASSPKPPPRKRIKKNEQFKSTSKSRVSIPKPVEIGKNSITFYSVIDQDQVKQNESRKYFKSTVLPLSVHRIIEKDQNLKSLLNSGEITISQMIPIESLNQNQADNDNEEFGDLIIDENQDSDSISCSTNSTSNYTESSESSTEPVQFDLLKYSALLLDLAKKAEKDFHQEVKDNLDWGQALSNNGYFTKCLSQQNSSKQKQKLMPPPPPILKYGHKYQSPFPLPLSTFSSSKYTKDKDQLPSIINNNFNYDMDLKIKNAFQQNQNESHSTITSTNIYSNGFDNDNEVGYLDLSLSNPENKKSKSTTQNGINYLNLNRAKANEQNGYKDNNNTINEASAFDDNDNSTKYLDSDEKNEFENSIFDPNRFLELAYDDNEPGEIKNDIGLLGSHRNNLSKMKLTKPKLRNHLCTYCFKNFTQSADLKRHVYIHTGLKPFKCDYLNCPESFMKKSLLIEHKRNCHTLFVPTPAATNGKCTDKSPKVTSNSISNPAETEIPPIPMPLPTLDQMKSFFTTYS